MIDKLQPKLQLNKFKTLLQCLFLALILLLTTFPVPANAAADPQVTNAPALTPAKSPRWETIMLSAQSDIAGVFDLLAEKLDRFITGERLTKDKNETKAVIENYVVFPEGTKAYTVTDFNVSLRLPNFEKYWQLKFSDYDEQKKNRGLRRAFLKSNKNANEKKNYGTSLGIFKKFEKVKFSFQPRLSLGKKLDLSHSLALDSSLKLDHFEFRPKLEFFATPDKGTGIYNELNFIFELDTTYTISWINEGEYEENENKFTATQGLNLRQVLTEVSSMNYYLFFVSNTIPSYHLDSHVISSSYGRTIYKDFIETSISLSLDFAKERRFKGFFTTAFNLNIIF